MSVEAEIFRFAVEAVKDIDLGPDFGFADLQDFFSTSAHASSDAHLGTGVSADTDSSYAGGPNYEVRGLYVREPTAIEATYADPAESYLKLLERYIDRDIGILENPKNATVAVSLEDNQPYIERYKNLLAQVRYALDQDEPQRVVRELAGQLRTLQSDAGGQIMFSAA